MEATLDAPIRTLSPTARWAGRVITAVPVLFLLFDLAIKIASPPIVAETSAQLGLPAYVTPITAVLLAACLALYLFPRTAVLGAVFFTGYLGGAVLVHLRVGDPLFTHTLFPIYVGALLWAGLYLRDARVRRMISAH